MKDSIKLLAKALLIMHLLTYTPTVNALKQISKAENGQALAAVESKGKVQLSSYQRVKRGIVDSIKSFLNPNTATNAILYTMAPIVKAALPYVLVPLAIVPLAGLVSSYTGKERRETEETIAEFLFKELPAFINQMVSETRNEKGQDKSVHQDDQKPANTSRPEIPRPSRSRQGYPYDFHNKDVPIPQT